MRTSKINTRVFYQTEEEENEEENLNPLLRLLHSNATHNFIMTSLDERAMQLSFEHYNQNS